MSSSSSDNDDISGDETEQAMKRTMSDLKASARNRFSSSSPSSSSSSSWSERWRQSQAPVTCVTCGEETVRSMTVECSSCPQSFHRSCVQPYWTAQQWADAETQPLLCDDCASTCVLCGVREQEEDDDENPATALIVCDSCEDYFHWACLDEDARCPASEIGDESATWLCPECDAEFEDDDDAEEEAHYDLEEVDSDDMGADECFSRSTCACDVCASMNTAADKWDDADEADADDDDSTMHVAKRLREAIDSPRMSTLLHSLDNVHFRHGVPPPDRGGGGGKKSDGGQ